MIYKAIIYLTFPVSIPLLWIVTYILWKRKERQLTRQLAWVYKYHGAPAAMNYISDKPRNYRQYLESIKR